MLRVIARLDIKSPNLIKGVRLEGLRVIGDPAQRAIEYFEQGIDEILYMDIVASLYGRNHLTELLEHTAKNVFVPITVGGGIRSVEDALNILRAGADKVAINTAAIENPQLISQLANVIGKQSVVVSIEAKKMPSGSWQAFTDNGRGQTGLDVMTWAQDAERLGCGELLITSVDREGTRKGFDHELIQQVKDCVSIPVIASGGFSEPSDLNENFPLHDGGIAIADAFHFDRYQVKDVKERLHFLGYKIRNDELQQAIA